MTKRKPIVIKMSVLRAARRKLRGKHKCGVRFLDGLIQACAEAKEPRP